jgi:ethanolamine utilization microcompartment shell protein EutS
MSLPQKFGIDDAWSSFGILRADPGERITLIQSNILVKLKGNESIGHKE